MLFGYASTIILLAIIIYSIKTFSFFKIDDWSTKWSFLAFGLKVMSGIAVWLIYTYYYTERINADIYKYFDDAQYIIQQTENNALLRWKLIFGIQDSSSNYLFLNDTSFWFSQGEVFFNDNRTMTRIHLILLHLSGGVYHFHTLTFAFLAFIGSFGLFHFFRKFSILSSTTLFTFAFLVPSVLLWTSAPLKESYLFFSLGILLWTLSQLKDRSIRPILFVLIGIFNLFLLKVYILISLLPGVLFWLISSRTKHQRPLLIQFSILSCLGLLLTLLFQQQLIEILSTKQQQFIDLLHSSGAKSGIPIGQFNSIGEFFMSIPHALFNVYIRPVLPSSWNPFSLLAALEHAVLIVLPLVALVRYKKPPSPQSLRLFLFALTFILTAGIIIGSTTPILGAIVRYKAPIIPFYLVVVFTFVDDKKLLNLFK